MDLTNRIRKRREQFPNGHVKVAIVRGFEFRENANGKFID